MIKLVQYHTYHKVRNGYESCQRVALVKKGHKWLKVLCIDATSSGGLRLWKVPVSEMEYMKPIMRGNKEYTVKKALVTFRKFLKEHGGTKGAKKLLREASSEQKERKDLGGKGSASPTGDTEEGGSTA